MGRTLCKFHIGWNSPFNKQKSINHFSSWSCQHQKKKQKGYSYRGRHRQYSLIQSTCHMKFDFNCTSDFWEQSMAIRNWVNCLESTAVCSVKWTFECKNMIFILTIILNMCLRCLKEPSDWDSSHPQHMFWLRNTVNPVLSGHSKRTQKLFFKIDYRIMQVKNIAECSQGAYCYTLDLHLASICLYDICFVYL